MLESVNILLAGIELVKALSGQPAQYGGGEKYSCELRSTRAIVWCLDDQGLPVSQAGRVAVPLFPPARGFKKESPATFKCNGVSEAATVVFTYVPPPSQRGKPFYSAIRTKQLIDCEVK
jgi:hypothetical protein